MSDDILIVVVEDEMGGQYAIGTFTDADEAQAVADRHRDHQRMESWRAEHPDATELPDPEDGEVEDQPVFAWVIPLHSEDDLMPELYIERRANSDRDLEVARSR